MLNYFSVCARARFVCYMLIIPWRVEAIKKLSLLISVTQSSSHSHTHTHIRGLFETSLTTPARWNARTQNDKLKNIMAVRGCVWVSNTVWQTLQWFYSRRRYASTPTQLYRRNGEEWQTRQVAIKEEQSGSYLYRELSDTHSAVLPASALVSEVKPDCWCTSKRKWRTANV